MPEPEVHTPGCAFLDGTGPCRCWSWKDQTPGRNTRAGNTGSDYCAPECLDVNGGPCDTDGGGPCRDA